MKRKRDSMEVAAVKDATFTEIEFKFMIRNAGTGFSALEKFLEQAEKYPAENDTDIVASYCQSSGECEEIFKLMEAGKRKPTELCLIFRTLECILLRITDDLPQYKLVSQHMVRRILASHIGVVYFMLSPANRSNQIKAALKLLVAMVMQGEGSTKEIQAQFNFSHHSFPQLLKRRDTKDPQDVRTCLLHLMMSFLIAGDDQVIKQLVDVKGFLNSLFEGLKIDKLSAIQLVLPTLKDKVVLNTTVNKTSKLRLFSDRSLRELAGLYHWKGESGKQSGRSEEEAMEMEFDDTTLSEDQQTVREMVHSLFLEVCCSFKHGINFFDKSFSTSGKNQNHTLTNFLTHLPKPYQSQLTRELVTKVLVACPDQLHWYLPSLRHALAPRVSAVYIQCCHFLRQIYEAQPEVCPVLKLSESIPVSKLVTMAVATMVPPKEIWTLILAAIRHKEQVIQHEGLAILVALLKRINATLQHCQSGVTLYSGQEMTDFMMAFRQALVKMLPNVGQLMQCWSKTISTTTPMEEGDSDTEMAAQADQDKPVIEKPELQLAILQVLCGYQSAFPSLLKDQPLDFSPLLEGVRPGGLDGASAERQQLLQLHVLKLLSESDARQLSWLKETGGKQSTLHLLLEMVLTTRDTPLAATTRYLLKKLLGGTGLFLNAETELDSWLHHLSDAEEAAVGFFEKALAAVIHDPYTYAEQISELVAEAGTLGGGGSVDMETASVATSSALIDTILSMEETSLTEEEPWNVTATGVGRDETARFPFSSLVAAALKVLADHDSGLADAVPIYLGGVLTEILHTQSDPVPMCLLLQRCATTLLANTPDLQDTLNRFLPGKKRNKKSKLTPKKKVTTKKAAGDLDKAKLLEKASLVGLEEAPRLARQTLLDLKNAVDELKGDFPGAEENIHQSLEVLKVIIQRLSTTTEETPASDPESTEVEQSLQMIQMPKATQKQTMIEVCRLVLQHPTIREVFLYEQGLAKKKRTAHRLVELLTPQMAQLVCQIPADIWEDLREDFMIFIHALEEETTEALQKGDPDSLKSVMHKLVVFLTQIPPGALLSLCEKMLCGGSIPNSSHLLRAVLVLCKEPNRDTLAQFGLSHRAAGHFFKLLIQETDTEIIRDAVKFLEVAPCYATCTTKGFVSHCLNDGSSHWVALAVQCVRHSAACRRWLEQWCLESLKAKKLKKMDYLLVVKQYLLSSDTDCSGQKAVLSLLRQQFMPVLKQWVLQSTADDESKESSELKLDVFTLLVQKTFNSGAVNELWEELTSHMTQQAPPTSQQVDLLVAVAKQLEQNPKGLAVKVVGGLTSALIGALKAKGSKEKRMELSKKILQHILEWLSDALSTDEELAEILQPMWVDLVKHGLRNCFSECTFLKMLNDLIPIVYTETAQPAVPLSQLYDMVLSHSLFTQSVLGDSPTDIKESVVDLLLTVVRREPACCQTPHIAILLGAYGATLSKTDQKLLLLLHLYETRGCNMAEYKPYMWGSKAVEHHSLKKNLGPSLWKQPSTDEVIKLLDTDVLHKSTLLFPLRRKLKLEDVVDAADLKTSPEVYDPCFLLPVFSHLLSPASFVNCSKFIEHGCLGYILCALSAHDAGLRAVAYHLLAAYQLHLEGAKFSESTQLGYLLDCLRNSVEKPGAKLPCVVTAFLARGTRMLLKPDEHMYQLVNSFLLLKPSMDLGNIPDFYKLFNSSALEFKVERSWMLSLMLDGLRETADYHIYQKRHTFKLLLAFGASSFCDAQSQSQVLEVLNQACSIKRAAFELVKHHGLLAWITALSTCSDARCLPLLVKTLHTLWFTMLDQRDEQPQDSVVNPLLPPLFTNEILLTLLSLLRKARSFPTAKVFTAYVSCLQSVLSHQAKTQRHLASTTGTNLVIISPSHVDLLLLLKTDAEKQRGKSTEMDHLLTALGFCEQRVTLDSSETRRGKKLAVESTNSDLAPGVDTEGSSSSENILKIVCLWKPPPNPSAPEKQALFCIWKWALEKLDSVDDLRIVLELLQWVETAVLHLEGIKTELLNRTDSRTVYLISKTLAMYGKVEAIVSEVKCVEKQTVVLVRQNLNKIFQCLLDHVLCEASAKSAMLGQLQSKPYRDAVQVLAKASNRPELDGKVVSSVCILVQEIWLRAESPEHFFEMWK